MSKRVYTPGDPKWAEFGSQGGKASHKGQSKRALKLRMQKCRDAKAAKRKEAQK